VAVPRCGGDTNPQRGNLGYITMDGGGSDGPRNPHSDRDTHAPMVVQTTHAPHSNKRGGLAGRHTIQRCIAKDWEQAQDAYYKWCRSRKSARRWTTALSQKLWNVAWDLWEHRNGIVHAAENAEILHGMAETDNEIRVQFQQGPHGLQQRDHGLFPGPVNGILAASIVYRQWWLQRVQTARARASRRQAETYSGERQWLQGGIQGGNGGHEN
jgi:hypothetical protein